MVLPKPYCIDDSGSYPRSRSNESCATEPVTEKELHKHKVYRNVKRTTESDECRSTRHAYSWSNASVENIAVNSVKGTIRGINNAVTRRQRIEALKVAHKYFDHKDEKRHQVELQEGAVNALYQKLCLGMVEGRKGMDEEVLYFCEILEMIFRVSKDTLERSVDMFIKYLLPVLLRILEMYEQRLTDQSEKIILSAMRFLYTFSQTSLAVTAMIVEQNLLSIFTRMIVSSRSSLTRICVLFTISELANEPKNSACLLSSPDMLVSVLYVASMDPNPDLKEVAARAIQSLCFSGASMPEECFSDLLNILISLSNGGTRTKKYVSGSLRALTERENMRELLVYFDKGKVLDVLVVLMDSDKAHSRTRYNAAKAYKNLICELTAEHMIKKKNILQILVNLATDNPFDEMRDLVEQSLILFASYINHPFSCHNELLSSLVQVGLSRMNCRFPTNIASALLQLSLNTNNREVMANNAGLLNFLYMAASPKTTNSHEVKEDALLALSFIAGRES